MTRSLALRLAMIATPLVAGAIYIALNWYEIEKTPTRTGFREPAIQDPYLAYTRLLERMGTATVVAKGPSQFDTLPEKGVAIVGTLRLVHMTPARLAKLQAWVQRGGMLVAGAEPLGVDDPLLEAFGVEREVPEESSKKGKRGDPPDLKKLSAEDRGIVEIEWPGAPRKLRVRQVGPGLLLQNDRITTESQRYLRNGKTVAIVLPVAAGRVVALTDLRFLDNRSIGNNDHAEFGWRLASSGGTGRSALLYLQTEDPSLIDWLLDNAWPLLMAAALALLAWLARAVPRFGPLAPEAPPVRRSLIEHLRANGRFLWSRDAGATLIGALRERTWRTASRRRGGLASPADPGSRDVVAEMSRTSRATIDRALLGTPTRAADFIATATALQSVDGGLTRRPSGPHSPKKDVPR